MMPSGWRAQAGLLLYAALALTLTACAVAPVETAAPIETATPPVAFARPVPESAARIARLLNAIPDPSEGASLSTDLPVPSEARQSLAPGVPPAPTLILAEQRLRELARGGASWYGPRFHGRRTASGERYDMNAFTAAHRSLPFGTVIRVKSLVNGREVEVRVNDRGPFSRSRILDLSRAAAAELGMLSMGVKDVVLLVPAVQAPQARLAADLARDERSQ